MKFGIIADDNTGAADAAGMLTERGVRSVLFLDIPDPEHCRQMARTYDAVVIGVNSRSIPAAEAYCRTRDAVQLLMKMRAEKIQIKYCSTFDSTPHGNIGPSLDAAMDIFGAKATIVSPALPVNQRTTYCGYHFVAGRLLSESPLSNHPINPMTDANLVRWLQLQTKRTVALAPLAIIRKGPRALAQHLRDGIEKGEAYFVTDTLEQNDLAIIAKATADWALISGGSGITAEIPRLLFPGAAPLSFAKRLSACSRKTLVIAGSCAPMTLAQNRFALANGFAGLRVDAAEALAGKVACADLAASASRELSRGKNVLLHASSDPEEVARTQARGEALGLTTLQIGERIAALLSAVAALLVERAAIGRLIVSGGETSGAVCRALDMRALEVGLPIDPGVPYCFSGRHPGLVVTLKSGNFGSKEFYFKVQQI